MDSTHPTPWERCPPLVGVPYLAEQLQCSDRTLHQLARRGELPLVRRGRRLVLSRPALIDFVTSHTVEPW